MEGMSEKQAQCALLRVLLRTDFKTVDEVKEFLEKAYKQLTSNTTQMPPDGWEAER